MSLREAPKRVSRSSEAMGTCVHQIVVSQNRCAHIMLRHLKKMQIPASIFFSLEVDRAVSRSSAQEKELFLYVSALAILHVSVLAHADTH